MTTYADWGVRRTGTVTAGESEVVYLTPHSGKVTVVCNPTAGGTYAVEYTIDDFDTIENGSPVWIKKTLVAKSAADDETVEGLWSAVKISAVTEDCDYTVKV